MKDSGISPQIVFLRSFVAEKTPVQKRLTGRSLRVPSRALHLKPLNQLHPLPRKRLEQELLVPTGRLFLQLRRLPQMSRPQPGAPEWDCLTKYLPSLQPLQQHREQRLRRLKHRHLFRRCYPPLLRPLEVK